MSTDDPTVALPQPDDITQRERDDAMGAYLMMFASLAVGLPIPLLNLVASVIYFFVNKKTSAFVAFHALQALLSHIPVVLLNAGVVAWIIANVATHSSSWGWFLWYLFFSILVNLTYVVWSIVALVHANKGRFFYMPFFGRISFARYYGPRTERLRPAPRVWENKPPEGF
ncbi:MAG TPA: DUF4870 domain-containing protein [Spirochaetia bacterium]|nr:DUF4870 domain-containing protein [Spirochaetia bacterium]